MRHYEEAHIDLDLDQEGTETDDVFLGYTDPNEVEVQIQGNVVQKVVCEFCGEVYAVSYLSHHQINVYKSKSIYKKCFELCT